MDSAPSDTRAIPCASTPTDDEAYLRVWSRGAAQLCGTPGCNIPNSGRTAHDHIYPPPPNEGDFILLHTRPPGVEVTVEGRTPEEDWRANSDFTEGTGLKARFRRWLGRLLWQLIREGVDIDSDAMNERRAQWLKGHIEQIARAEARRVFIMEKP